MHLLYIISLLLYACFFLPVYVSLFRFPGSCSCVAFCVVVVVCLVVDDPLTIQKLQRVGAARGTLAIVLCIRSGLDDVCTDRNRSPVVIRLVVGKILSAEITKRGIRGKVFATCHTIQINEDALNDLGITGTDIDTNVQQFGDIVNNVRT